MRRRLLELDHNVLLALLLQYPRLSHVSQPLPHLLDLLPNSTYVPTFFIQPSLDLTTASASIHRVYYSHSVF